MQEKRHRLASIFIVILFISFPMKSSAQEHKQAITSHELYLQIRSLDSMLFDAYNTQNMPTFKAMFSKDLEWFQDNGGLLNFETVFKNFDDMFHREYKLSRSLVSESLDVHPIKDYGAIEIGTHQFRHIENGKEEVGTFKFLMIWKNENEEWKITKVISYDH